MKEPVRILCVDDEKNVLKALFRLFLDEEYELLTAGSGTEGLELLEANRGVQIVISDYRMPEMNGVDFLRQVCERWPDTVRIVLSGYADTASVVSAINEGQIYKFIPKPWNDDELKVTVKNALDHYFAEKRNRELAQQLKEKNQELEILNQNLERMVEMRTSKLMFRNRALAAAQSILDLLPTGIVGLDEEGMVVQCNRRASSSQGDGIVQPTAMGGRRSDVLPKEVNDFVDRFLADPSCHRELMTLEGHTWQVQATAMPQGGALLVFCAGCEQ